MPRRFREYLDRLSRRDTHREEPNTYTANTTVNLNDWQPVRWNTTQWFPDTSENTRQMLENAYNVTAQEIMEMADAEATPENMLRLVRLSMPNINRNNVVEERPMDPPRDWLSRTTSIPASYLYPNGDVVYSEYTPSWSNRTISWNWGGKGHVEFRRGKIIRVKRYCKI